MRSRKFQALVAAVICLCVLLSAGCSPKYDPDEIDVNYEWLDSSYTDTSQLSDYAGKNTNVSLKAWNVTGTGNNVEYDSSQDIVSEEIRRVTGVKVGEVTDNRGLTANGRYAQILSAGDIPDIAYGSGWIDTEEVWDLTDLVDKYCPTIKSRMPASVWNSGQVNGGEKGKIYGIPYGLGNVSLSTLDSRADPEKTIMFSFQHEYYPYIYVREDILKDAYPNAKTQQEIDDLYARNGKFTEEELFDVEITSAEQFRTEFLPAIQNVIETKRKDDGTLKYKAQNGRMVGTMLTTYGTGSGSDNWSLLGVLLPSLLGGTMSFYNHMFSYWDVSTQKVELMLLQDFYKDEFYEWAKMIAQGDVVSDYGVTTDHATLINEMNSGLWAIGYQPSMMATGNVCTFTSENGETETVNYRKVYMKIPRDEEHFEYFVTGEPAVSSVMFFKDKVQENMLPQLLRWLDYQCSILADKLYAWGPSSAGLFTEENGIRVYKDEALADQMVYNTYNMGELVQKYNLSNGTLPSAQPVFSFVYAAASVDHPKCSYDLSQIKGLANSYFTSAAVCKEEVSHAVPIKKTAGIQQWKNTELDGVEELWGKRKLIEDQLSKMLRMGSKSAFDSGYAALENILNSNGWTKAYFNGKFTSAFLQINEDFLQYFVK